MRSTYTLSNGVYRYGISIYLVLTIILLGVVGGVPVWSQEDVDPAVQSQSVDILCALEESFTEIAERARPGVVSVIAMQRAETGSLLSRSEYGSLEEFFRRFFGDDPSERFDESEFQWLFPDSKDIRAVTAAGSGAIVHRNGDNFYVLTNHHVVVDAHRVSVRLSDGVNLRGSVVGIDPVTDLAVIEITSNMLTERNVITLGDSDKVKVGAWVLAVGSPFGFDHTVTVGVVSALHRELEEDGTIYPDLIQTDASINRGNSGGPLVDVHGHVIGVNTAIASPTGSFIGLGFAIPINTAKEILDQLIAEGRVIRGWLGIGIQELNPVLQEYYGVQEGVLIASVDDRGPAARAGIRSEDIVTSIDGTTMADARQLQRHVAGLRPETSVAVGLMRDGMERSLNVRIGLSPSTPLERPSPTAQVERMEIGARTLTRDLARRIGLAGTVGVIVTGVTLGSPAEEAGLEEGDIVTAINGRVVADEADFQTVLHTIPRGNAVVLRVLRENSLRMVGFRME